MRVLTVYAHRVPSRFVTRFSSNSRKAWRTPVTPVKWLTCMRSASIRFSHTGLCQLRARQHAARDP
jgi:hypothetical protein